MRPSAEEPATLLHDLVVRQARRTPEALAVAQWDRRLTYRELVAAATAVAVPLRSLGVAPEVRVAVCGARSPELLAGVLGVLLAGGAYVPLDPAHPRERLLAILDDGGIDIAVVDAAGAALLAGTGRHLVRLPSGADGPAVATDGLPGAATGPAVAHPGPPVAGNAAYVLYTSGSSGTPKGVVVSHHSAVAFVTETGELFKLDERCRSIGFAALSFDVSILDIFVPLSRGGSVQLIPDQDRVDPARLQRFLEAHEVTWGAIAPALLGLLEPNRLPDLTDLITAGEPPGPEQVARWSAPPRRRFHNWYGPTETTVCVVGTELTGHWHRPPPIGRALPGCTAYVLDEALRPCPPGVAGELCIAGPQLARGYLGRPGLTAERFVPDPYGDQPGARLYRTGDRVRQETDGRIAFLGRLDRQVKVRGQRVELGEVESVLRGHPRVTQAVADVSPDGELVAYVAPLSAPDLDELVAHCAHRLPSYMAPTRLVRVAALPLTVAGKVDLPTLRDLRDRRSDGHPAAARPAAPADGGPGRGTPGTPTERAVAAIWARILRAERPSLDDEFGAAGGQSLLAMRLVSALRAELRRDVTVRDVFECRTLGRLVARVEQAAVLGADIGVPLGNPPALGPVQQRQWFVERLAPSTPVHNIAMAHRLRGQVDVDALATALRSVEQRHDVLRWRITDDGGAPSVLVDPADPARDPLTVVDVPDDADVPDQLRAEAQRPFHLATGPLWRATLFRITPTHHVLAVTVHHLVFDGWSQDVFHHELAQAYAAAVRGGIPTLPALPAGYGDYVAWSRDRRRTRQAANLTWWEEHLAGVPTVLDLPRDRARPPVQTFRGAAGHASVQPAITNRLRRLAGRLQTTPYVVLLAAFAQLVRRLTGQTDMIVGTPFADRRHVAFEPLIGCCVEVLPLRLRVDDDVSFAEHVTRCQLEFGAAFTHADLPLEQIVERLGAGRDLSRSGLVQVLFNMYNFAEPRLRLDGLDAEPLPPGLPGALFDLTLYVSEAGDRLSVQAVYNPDLYAADRIDALLASYTWLLDALVARPDDPVRSASARPQPSGLPDWSTPLPDWRGAGVVERVRQVAAGAPGTIAASGTTGSLTYRELTARSESTSAAVIGAGVSPGDTVAVLAARQVGLPALLLGVLASGARWAILDPALPPMRLRAQARAVNARALLCAPGVAVPDALVDWPLIQPEDVDAGSDPGAATARPQPAESRGYLAFTSGSTGDPKPVASTERPLAHFLDWYPRTFQLGQDDRFALLAGLSHDPLLRDAFTPLVLGARVCVPEQAWLRDPVRLAAWLAAQEVTVAHLTPQLARLLTGVPAARLDALRLVGVAGDRLTGADVAGLRRLAPHARICNLYGTTETPQVQAYYEVTSEPIDGSQQVPVGSGVPGAQLIVLDAAGRPAATGELGEVVIRSRWLATGYLPTGPDGADSGHPDADRFGRTPYGENESDRAYRTGDLGRYRPDGTVVLAGRRDDQVKIRGYRVELGDIEAVLAGHPDVSAGAVVADDAQDGARLRAYAVPAHPGTDAQALRQYLRAHLPEYAVPADLLMIPALPLTANGKLDRAALPRATPRPAVGRDEPATATERLVAGVWRAVLGLPRVGATDNFFDVGGHSLAIVAVQARLAERLRVDLPIVELFRHPTVRALAACIDHGAADEGLDRADRRVAERRGRSRRGSPSRR